MIHIRDKAGKVYAATIHASYKLNKFPTRWGYIQTLSIDVIELNGKFLGKRNFNTFFDDMGNPFTFCDAAGNEIL